MTTNDSCLWAIFRTEDPRFRDFWAETVPTKTLLSAPVIRFARASAENISKLIEMLHISSGCEKSAQISTLPQIIADKLREKLWMELIRARAGNERFKDGAATLLSFSPDVPSCVLGYASGRSDCKKRSHNTDAHRQRVREVLYHLGAIPSDDPSDLMAELDARGDKKSDAVEPEENEPLNLVRLVRSEAKPVESYLS